jgi:hypothetical protein
VPVRIAIPAGCAAIALFLVACQSVEPSPTITGRPTVSPELASQGPTASAGSVTLAQASACPTTRGEPTPSSIPADRFFGSGSAYGNGTLWVGGLWPDGIISADSRFFDLDGRVGMKFGWWHTIEGKVQITGRRLDAPAPPAIADVPDGYGITGFQASGVTFPTEGCWEITGSVGLSKLTFVTFVIKVPA